MVLAATPARAASADRNVTVEPQQLLTSIRCESLSSITVTVEDGNGLPLAGVAVSALLSGGLTAGGESSVSVTTGGDGTATLTGITVTGDAQTAQQVTVVVTEGGSPVADPVIIPVTVATGAVRGISYNSTANELSFDDVFATFYGASAVSASDTITYALAADTTVYYWGDASDATGIANRQQLMHAGGPIAPVIASSGWSTPRTTTGVQVDATAYALIADEDGTLYSIRSSHGNAPSVAATRATTPAVFGQILDIQVVQGAAYVLTDNGLYRTTTLTGTPQAFDIGASALTLLPGTAGVTAINPISGAGSGGLVQSGVWVFNSAGQAGFIDAASNSAPTFQSLGLTGGESIVTIHPSMNGALVFTSTGRILAHGSAWNGAGVYALYSAWTQVATGVVSLDTWAVSTAPWFGGAYALSDGTIRVFNISGPGSGWMPQTHWSYNITPAGPGVPVSEVFASDGVYAMITAAGEFWVWSGNGDWSQADLASSPPQQLLTEDSTPATVIGGSIWSFNAGGGGATSTFYGGGAVITDAPVVCPLP